jgi:intron-binding protein aquarius
MAKQARVIAMTCTHAALKRHEFLSYGLKYDNLVMEEAAQVLEIETFIPMQLQENQDGRSRLKRVVLIGDHNQLPPVVQNMALQKYSHLEQSLFARMVRLGNPVVQLDMQGRARPELADLYRWRYKELQDLSPLPPIVAQSEANPCMAHDYQLIDVPDFQGQGEFTPTPHFFQNLGEAEYVVALFMYECTVSSHNLHLTRIQNSASHVIAS